MAHSRLPVVIRAAVALASSIALLMPAAAGAGQASKSTDHFVEFFCQPATNAAGGTLFISVTVSDAFGVSAGVDYFEPGVLPFKDPSTLTTDFNGTPTATVTGGTLTAAIPVVDALGNPVGAASINATLVTGGSPQPIGDRFRDGNRWFRSSGTLLPLSVGGSIGLPGGLTFPIDNVGCAADETTISFFGTNPASYTSRFSSRSIGCALDDGAGATGFLFLDVDAAHTTVSGDAFVDPDLDAFVGGTLVNGSLSTSLTFDSGSGTGATGSLDLSLAATGQPFSYTLRGGTQLTRVTGTIYDVSGTLSVTGGPTFDLGACILSDSTRKQILSPTHIAAGGGKPPVNDLPSGAVAVRPGSNLAIQTKNASLTMEAPFDCLTFIDDNGVEQPLPVIKTVWFKLTGTGAAVALDTAGSGFDTVIAVYTAGAGTYVPVPGTCDDDVPLQPVGRTLQAATTFTAASGTTYFIQVGGFPDDLNWGSLHLAVR
jgi:hypothetical protein